MRCTKRTGAAGARAQAIFVMDGRRRARDLSVALRDGRGRIADARSAGLAAARQWRGVVKRECNGPPAYVGGSFNHVRIHADVLTRVDMTMDRRFQRRADVAVESTVGTRFATRTTWGADEAWVTADRLRLSYALLLSLLIHASLLTLMFGGDGLVAPAVQLSLAGSTHRSTRSSRRTASRAGRAGGAGGRTDRRAFATRIGRTLPAASEAAPPPLASRAPNRGGFAGAIAPKQSADEPSQPATPARARAPAAKPPSRAIDRSQRRHLRPCAARDRVAAERRVDMGVPANPPLPTPVAPAVAEHIAAAARHAAGGGYRRSGACCTRRGGIAGRAPAFEAGAASASG